MNTKRVIVALLLVVTVGVGVGANVDFNNNGMTPVETVQGGMNPLVSDTDGDGLDDIAELNTYNTDPTSADTDDDGLNDGREIEETQTNPRESDTDGDGLDDGTEVRQYLTVPTEPDTDGDGLTDGEEVNEYNSDPTSTNTDGDNISDGEEVRTYGTNPTKTDTDDDGLDDNEEINQYDTDPTSADSDSDGLTDGDEIGGTYTTDPNRADTDSDGLNDSAEVRIYNTNPTKQDTTGDGLNDGIQVQKYNTDPSTNDTMGDGISDATYINYGVPAYRESTINETFANLSNHPDITTTPVFRGYSPSDNTGHDSTGDGFADQFAKEVPELDADRRNLVVSVQYMRGVDADVASLIATKEEYESAIDGGVNIVYYIDTNPIQYDAVTTKEEIRNDHNTQLNTHKLVFVDDISDDNVVGYATWPNNVAYVSESPHYAQPTTTTHEISHIAGLRLSFNGIDSREYSADEYQSVMNYEYADACRYDREMCTDLSDSSPHNDWREIYERLAETNKMNPNR